MSKMLKFAVYNKWPWHFNHEIMISSDSIQFLLKSYISLWYHLLSDTKLLIKQLFHIPFQNYIEVSKQACITQTSNSRMKVSKKSTLYTQLCIYGTLYQRFDQTMYPALVLSEVFPHDQISITCL